MGDDGLHSFNGPKDLFLHRMILILNNSVLYYKLLLWTNVPEYKQGLFH